MKFDRKALQQEMDRVLDQYLNGDISEEEVRRYHECLQNGEIPQEVMMDRSAEHEFTSVEIPDDIENIELPGDALVNLLKESDYLQQLEEELKQQKEPDELPYLSIHINRKFLPVLVFALLSVLMLPLVYFLLPSPASDQMFTEYFTPFDISSIDRDKTVLAASSEREKKQFVQNLQKWDHAKYIYAMGDYPEAIRLFGDMTVAQMNDEYIDQFLIGVSYLAQGHSRSAIDPLKAAVANEQNSLRSESVWYLALAYIHNNDLSAASPLLKLLSKDERVYKEVEAKEILQIIE